MTPQERQVCIDEAIAIVSRQSSAAPGMRHVRALVEEMQERRLLEPPQEAVHNQPDQPKQEATMPKDKEKQLPKNTNTKALQEAITLIVDAFNDTEAFIGSGEHNPVAVFSAYGNLFRDLMTLLPDIGYLPAELSELDSEDVKGIVDDVAQRLSLPSKKAEDIVAAAVQIFNDACDHLIGDFKNLFDAIKEKQAQATDSSN